MTQYQSLLADGGLAASGRIRIPTADKGRQRPLIVAVHGGGFTSHYFDIPGYSLLDAAAQQGCGVIALDRAGYGASSPPEGGIQSLSGNADWLDRVIERLWQGYDANYRGVVLIGHSIGSAVAIEVAARTLKWPLLGISVSGIGLGNKQELGAYWERVPPDSWYDFETNTRNQLMFGPEEFVPAGVRQLVQSAYVPIATRELVEICTIWPQRLTEVCGAVTAPLLYRQGQYDALWRVDEEQVKDFGLAFRQSVSTDTQIVRNAGHCIDFHYAGAQFHADEIAFAIRCAGGASSLPLIPK